MTDHMKGAPVRRCAAAMRFGCRLISQALQTQVELYRMPEYLKTHLYLLSIDCCFSTSGTDCPRLLLRAKHRGICWSRFGRLTKPDSSQYVHPILRSGTSRFRHQYSPASSILQCESSWPCSSQTRTYARVTRHLRAGLHSSGDPE